MLKKDQIEVTAKLIELWTTCIKEKSLEAFQNLFEANFELLETAQKKQIIQHIFSTAGIKTPAGQKNDGAYHYNPNLLVVEFFKQWYFAKPDNAVLMREADEGLRLTLKAGSDAELYYLSHLNHLITNGISLPPYCRTDSYKRLFDFDLFFVARMHLRASFLLVCYYFHRLPPERQILLSSQEQLSMRSFERLLITLKLLFGETPKQYELELPPVKDYKIEKYKSSELREDTIPELESYLLKVLPGFLIEKNKCNKNVESIFALLTGRMFSQPLTPVPVYLKALREMILAFMEKHREHKDQLEAMRRVRLMSEVWLYYYEGFFTVAMLKKTYTDSTSKPLTEPWGGMFSNQDHSVPAFLSLVGEMIKLHPPVSLSAKPKVNETVMKTEEQTSGSNDNAKEEAQSTHANQDRNSSSSNNSENKNLYPAMSVVPNNLSLIAEEKMMMHQLEAQHRSLEMLRAEMQHSEAVRQQQENLRQQYEAVRNRLAYLQNEIQDAQLELIDAQGEYQQLLVQSVNRNPPTMIAPVIPATSVVLSPITRYADIQKQAKEAEKVENPQPPVFVGDLIDLTDFSFSPK